MSMDTAPIRRIATTAIKYMKGAEDNTIRERILLAMMKRRGKFKFRDHGEEVKWPVKFDLPTARPYAGGQLDFTPSDKHRQLTAEWVAYKATDMMDEEEYLKNAGEQALVKRYDTILPDLVETLDIQFDTDIFNDGGTNTDRFWGLETFMNDGTTVVGDRVAQPSDTYCGRSTALAAEGGSWTSDLTTYPNAAVATDWPEGKGTTAYDYIAPKLINWGSTAWTNNAGSWSNNCIAALRRTNIWCQCTGGMKSAPDLLLLPNAMYDDFISSFDALFNVRVPHKEANDLGFAGKGVNFDGIWVTTQFGMTPEIGYLLNVDKMSFRVLGKDRLWSTEGPNWETRSQSYLFVAGGWGNFTFNPKYFAKFENYASA